MFKINEIKIKQDKIDQPDAVRAGIMPKHPFRSIICGASGSGKTNYLLSILTRFYNNYFDSIYVFSMTAKKLDHSYKVLKLPDEAYFSTSMEARNLIMKIQQKDIKDNGKANSKKCLVIFDDVVSDKKFMRSLVKPFIMMRHYNMSGAILTQGWHLVNKNVRINCSNVIFFKGALVEVEAIADQYTPPDYTKKQFIQKIIEATDEPYSFLFIDLNRSIEDGRYRKNLEEKIV